MDKLKAHDILLLLLYAPSEDRIGVRGITRLVKLLFILQSRLEYTALEFEKFEYKPYKIGPFSDGVYSSIEFLQNFKIPLIKSSQSRSKKTLNPEEWHLIDSYPLNELEEFNSDEYNSLFELTEEGTALAKYFWDNYLDDNQKRIFNEIKDKYGQLSLRNLLRIVYKDYPEFTTESEIKEVLNLK